jgi:hypothetical protein
VYMQVKKSWFFAIFHRFCHSFCGET